MHGDGDRASALAEERYIVGVAAERGDVVPHPLQGHHLVEETSVTGHIRRAEVQETETGYTILHRHHDHILLGHQGLVVVYVEGSRTGVETA